MYIALKNWCFLLSLTVMVSTRGCSVQAAKKSARAAKKSARNASRASPRSSRTEAPQKQSAAPQAQPAAFAAPTVLQTIDFAAGGLDSANITKYNCAEKFAACMDEQGCFSEQNGRCDCSNPPKFDEVAPTCAQIQAACPYMKDEVLQGYKTRATNDCRAFALAANAPKHQDNVFNVLAKLKICLQPICAEGPNEWVACFDPDNQASAMEKCAASYADFNDKPSLMKEFDKSVLSLKKKYCDETYGTMKDGECVIKIGIGPTQFDIRKTKDYKIGDMLVCSDEAFGTNSSYVDDRFKKELVRQLVVAGTSMVGAAVSAVGSAMESRAQQKQALAAEGANLDTIEKNDMKVAGETKTSVLKGEKGQFSNIESGSTAGGEGGYTKRMVSKDGSKLTQTTTEFAKNEDGSFKKMSTEDMASARADLATSATKMDGTFGKIKDFGGAIGGSLVGGAMGMIAPVMMLTNKDYIDKMTEAGTAKGACYIVKDEARIGLVLANDGSYFRLRWTTDWTTDPQRQESKEAQE
jgi:hypothetical protein